MLCSIATNGAARCTLCSIALAHILRIDNQAHGQDGRRCDVRLEQGLIGRKGSPFMQQRPPFGRCRSELLNPLEEVGHARPGRRRGDPKPVRRGVDHDGEGIRRRPRPGNEPVRRGRSGWRGLRRSRIMPPRPRIRAAGRLAPGCGKGPSRTTRQPRMGAVPRSKRCVAMRLRRGPGPSLGRLLLLDARHANMRLNRPHPPSATHRQLALHATAGTARAGFHLNRTGLQRKANWS